MSTLGAVRRAPRLYRRQLIGLVITAVVSAVLIAGAIIGAHRGQLHAFFIIACGAALLLAGLYVIWNVPPAYTLSVGVALLVFNGYWDNMGLPSKIAPDRVVLVAGLLSVMLRSPAMRRRPRLRLEPIHWVLLATALYALCSAVAAGTLWNKSDAAVLIERFGLIPFLFYFVGRAAFPTQKERDIFMAVIVVLGLYLGLTGLFEATGINALVWPKYILDPTVGIRPERTRGPLVDPPGFGVACFACAGVALIAWSRWRSRWLRALIAFVVLLDAASILFCLTRQVWLGALVGAVAVMIITPWMRRWIVPFLAAGALIVVAALAVVPGFDQKFQQRTSPLQEQSLWDRMNTNNAALRAIQDHPLFGMGWSTWTQKNIPYLQQASTYPLNASAVRIPVHNAFLGYGAELGLIGALLFAVSLLWGVGWSMLKRPPPEVNAWRLVALAVFLCDFVVINFQPGLGFPSVIVWVLPAIVLAPAFWAQEETVTVPSLSIPRRPAPAPSYQPSPTIQ
jgi:O-antigen ligase